MAGSNRSPANQFGAEAAGWLSPCPWYLGGWSYAEQRVNEICLCLRWLSVRLCCGRAVFMVILLGSRMIDWHRLQSTPSVKRLERFRQGDLSWTVYYLREYVGDARDRRAAEPVAHVPAHLFVRTENIDMGVENHSPLVKKCRCPWIHLWRCLLGLLTPVSFRDTVAK